MSKCVGSQSLASRVSIKGSRVGVKGSRVGVKCYSIGVSPSLRRAALTEGSLRRQHLVGVLLGPVLEQGLEQLRMRHHPCYFLSTRGQARASHGSPVQCAAANSTADSEAAFAPFLFSLVLSFPPSSLPASISASIPRSLPPSLSLPLSLSLSSSLFCTISFDFWRCSCVENGSWRATKRFDRPRSAIGAPA